MITFAVIMLTSYQILIDTIMKKLLSMIAFLAATMLLGSCSDSDDNPSEPTASGKAKTTVIIYGTTGGAMDFMFERYIADLAPALNNPSQLRVAVLYKYGRDKDNTVTMPNGKTMTWPHTGEKAFTGKLADAGDVVKFELTSKTNLSDLRPFKADGEDYQLWNDADLTDYLDEVEETMPAENYVLIIYGHGGGWDAVNDVDYLDEYKEDDDARAVTRGVLYDEWSESVNSGLALDMYELSTAVKNSKIGHFSGIFLHNCLMGNAESLSQIYDLSDYTICCMHSLYTDALPVSMLTKALGQTSDFAAAAKKMMADDKDRADSFYEDINGDMSLIDNKVYPELFPIVKRLTERLMTLYDDPAVKSKIDLAMLGVYMPHGECEFADLYDLAVKMAAATNDAELGTIRDDMKAYFDRLFLAQNCSFHCQQKAYLANPTKVFTISVLLVDSKRYEANAMSYFPGMTVMDAYEMTNFHKQTGFGDFLRIYDGVKPNVLTNPTGQEYEVDLDDWNEE